MKKLLLLTKTLLVAALLCVGQNAWADDYTWNFTNTTTWTTAKIATGSAVNLATDGEAPEGDEPYVTFTFAGADDYGAEIKYNAASKSVTGTNLWYAYNGNISENNVSIVVPNNKQVTFNLIIGSNTRATRYHLSNEGSDTNHDITSGNLVYSNTTGSDVTVTVWATNTRRTSGTTTTFQNGIVSIVLGDITYQYTINAVAGGTTIKQLAGGSTTEGETYGTYLPKAILYNSQYYVLNDANVSNFYTSYTMGDADATKEITYTLNANMKAFWEGENLSYVGHNWYSDGNQTNNADCSNGAAQCPYSGTSNGIKTSSTIASGIYDITIKPYRWGDSATEYTLQYSTDNTNWTTIETVSFAANSNDAYIADNVLIPGDSYLRLLSPGSTPRHAIDYIYVERTGEVATIGTYGYATFSSTSPVNVNVTGLEAYIATEKSGDYVTMQKVTGDVAANTGLVLKGSAGNYALPFAASGTSYSGTNKLFALDGSYSELGKGSPGTNYVLSVQSENVVWAPINAVNAPVTAGHAALYLDGGGARAISMSFGDDITGVENVEAAPAEAKAKEGKFIENGKLVIVKNGQKFNAAGAKLY